MHTRNKKKTLDYERKGKNRKPHKGKKVCNNMNNSIKPKEGKKEKVRVDSSASKTGRVNIKRALSALPHDKEDKETETEKKKTLDPCTLKRRHQNGAPPNNISEWHETTPDVRVSLQETLDHAIGFFFVFAPHSFSPKTKQQKRQRKITAQSLPNDKTHKMLDSFFFFSRSQRASDLPFCIRQLCKAEAQYPSTLVLFNHYIYI